MSQAETRTVVRAYHDAYRRGDVTVAGALLAESFKFSSPIMAFDSVQQHVAALVRFVPFITGIDMISELYGEEEATLVYDLHTTMPSAAAMRRCAEHFRVSEGRISSIIIIFDATPWRPIIQAAADIRGPLEVAEEGGQPDMARTRGQFFGVVVALMVQSCSAWPSTSGSRCLPTTRGESS